MKKIINSVKRVDLYLYSLRNRLIKITDRQAKYIYRIGYNLV